MLKEWYLPTMHGDVKAGAAGRGQADEGDRRAAVDD